MRHFSRSVGVLIQDYLPPLKHIQEDHKTSEPCSQIAQTGVSLNLMAFTLSLHYSEGYDAARFGVMSSDETSSATFSRTVM